MIRFVCMFFLMFWASSARADVRLAVLEFRGIGVSSALLKVLADDVRAGVLNVSKGKKIQGKKLLIMTRENIIQVLKDQGLTPEDCTGECEIEVAKNIGADYVISGDVTKLGSTFVFNVKLHATSDSNLLSTESLKTKSQDQLISQASTMGAKVFREGLNLKGTSSTSRRQSQSSMNSESGEFSSNSGFGDGVQGNLQQKLKEKRCREYAENEANRQREERIDKEVLRLQQEATKAWNAMQEDFSTCLELDLEDRTPCQEALEEWYGNASALKVVLNRGTEKVETDCGVREEVFDTMSRMVKVTELEVAKQMRNKLKRNAVQSSESPSRFTGKKISLDFVNADIHSVFRLISHVSKLNIVTDDDVRGKITVSMKEVPWDQALSTILQSKGLGSQRFGDIIRVAPIEVIKAEQESRVEVQKSQAELMDIQILVIPLNYAQASELEGQVRDLLSSRGSLQVDQRGNQLIIKDSEKHLALIRERIRQMDR